MKTISFQGGVLIAVGALVCMSAQAADVTIPNKFTAGTPARAAQVNDNFSALASAVNTMNARLSALESAVTSADVIGTYDFNGMRIQKGAETGFVSIGSYITEGRMVIHADGSCTFSGVWSAGTEAITNLDSVPAGDTTNYYLKGSMKGENESNGTGACTWKWNDKNHLSLTLPEAQNTASLRVSRGGLVMTGIHVNGHFNATGNWFQDTTHLTFVKR